MTLEQRLTDEVKERILNEVERERRKFTVIRLFDDAFGGEKTEQLTYAMIRHLPILARLDPQKFAKVYTHLVETGFTRRGFTEGGYATLGYGEGSGRIVIDLLRELAPIDSKLFRETWEYLVNLKEDGKMKILDLREPDQRGFLEEKRRVANTLDALGPADGRLLVDILRDLSGHPLLNDIFDTLIPAFSFIPGLDFKLFSAYYDAGLSSTDYKTKRETAKSIRRLAECDKERFVELYRAGIQHSDEQVCQATASTLDALATVDPNMFTVLFEWSMQQNRIVKEGLARCVGALAPIDKRLFLKYYEQLMEMRMTSFLDFYPWILDLGALALVDAEQFVQLYRKWPIARQTDALVALANVDPDRFIELYNEFHDDTFDSSERVNHKVVHAMLRVIATRDVERFVKTYEAYASRYGNDPALDGVNLLAPLAEAAPERFSEICESTLLEYGTPIVLNRQNLALVTARSLKLLPKINVRLFYKIFEFYTDHSYTDPRSAWDDDEILEKSNDKQKKIEEGYTRIRLTVAKALPALAEVRLDYYEWRLHSASRDLDREFVITCFEAIEALADINPRAFRRKFEAGIKHPNPFINIGTAKSLGKLALLDAHRCFEVYGELSVYPDAELLYRATSAIPGLASTIDQEDVTFVRDEQFLFFDECLDKGIFGPPSSDPAFKDNVVNELKKVLANPRLDYPRLRKVFAEGKAKTLDEVVECGSIEVPNFLVLKRVGRGAFKRAYLAQNIHSCDESVLLIIDPTSKGFDHYQNIHGDLSHAQLRARIYAAEFSGIKLRNLVDPRYIGLISPPVVGRNERGDKVYILETNPYDHTLEDELEYGHISVETTLRYLAQLVVALQNCHNAGIVHKDFKPNNVGISKDGNIVLSDFGCTSVFSVDVNARYRYPLTLRPPELAYDREHWEQTEMSWESDLITPETNVWTFAVIAYRMITGKHLFEPPEQRALPGAPEYYAQNEVIYQQIINFDKRKQDVLKEMDRRIGSPMHSGFERCFANDPQRRKSALNGLRVGLGYYLGNF